MNVKHKKLIKVVLCTILALNIFQNVYAQEGKEERIERNQAFQEIVNPQLEKVLTFSKAKDTAQAVSLFRKLELFQLTWSGFNYGYQTPFVPLSADVEIGSEKWKEIVSTNIAYFSQQDITIPQKDIEETLSERINEFSRVEKLGEMYKFGEIIWQNDTYIVAKLSLNSKIIDYSLEDDVVQALHTEWLNTDKLPGEKPLDMYLLMRKEGETLSILCRSTDNISRKEKSYFPYSPDDSKKITMSIEEYMINFAQMYPELEKMAQEYLAKTEKWRNEAQAVYDAVVKAEEEKDIETIRKHVDLVPYVRHDQQPERIAYASYFYKDNNADVEKFLDKIRHGNRKEFEEHAVIIATETFAEVGYKVLMRKDVHSPWKITYPFKRVFAYLEELPKHLEIIEKRKKDFYNIKQESDGIIEFNEIEYSLDYVIMKSRYSIGYWDFKMTGVAKNIHSEAIHNLDYVLYLVDELGFYHKLLDVNPYLSGPLAPNRSIAIKENSFISSEALNVLLKLKNGKSKLIIVRNDPESNKKILFPHELKSMYEDQIAGIAKQNTAKSIQLVDAFLSKITWSVDLKKKQIIINNPYGEKVSNIYFEYIQAYDKNGMLLGSSKGRLPIHGKKKFTVSLDTITKRDKIASIVEVEAIINGIVYNDISITKGTPLLDNGMIPPFLYQDSLHIFKLTQAQVEAINNNSNTVSVAEKSTATEQTEKSPSAEDKTSSNSTVPVAEKSTTPEQAEKTTLPEDKTSSNTATPTAQTPSPIAPQPKKSGKAVLVTTDKDYVGLTAFSADSKIDTLIRVLSAGKSPLIALRVESYRGQQGSWKTKDVKLDAQGVLAVYQGDKALNKEDAPFSLDLTTPQLLDLYVQDNGVISNNKNMIRVIFFHKDGTRTYSILQR